MFTRVLRNFKGEAKSIPALKRGTTLFLIMFQHFISCGLISHCCCAPGYTSAGPKVASPLVVSMATAAAFGALVVRTISFRSAVKAYF